MKKTRLTAAAAAVALGVTTALAFALPSSAADTYYLDSDVGVEGTSYPDNAWFVGTNPAAAAEPLSTDDGLELNGRTILLYGTAAQSITGAELQALVDGASVNADGAWTFQIPVFLNGGGSDLGFTTFRPVDANAVSTTGQWVSSRAVGGLTANTPVAFTDIVAAVDGGDAPQLLAYGVIVQSGTTTVASITWGGDTSFFTPAPEDNGDGDDDNTGGADDGDGDDEDDTAAPAEPVEDNVTYAG